MGEELSELIAAMFRTDESLATFMEGCAKNLRLGTLPPAEIADDLERIAEKLRATRGYLKERLGL